MPYRQLTLFVLIYLINVMLPYNIQKKGVYIIKQNQYCYYFNIFELILTAKKEFNTNIKKEF